MEKKDLFFLKASKDILTYCNEHNAFIETETREELVRRGLEETNIDEVLSSGRFCNIRGYYTELETMSKLLFDENEWLFLPYDIALFCDILLDRDAIDIRCLIVSYHGKRYLAFFEDTKEKMDAVLAYANTHDFYEQLIPAGEVLCNI